MSDDACAVCGFDHELYDRSDTVTSQRVIARVLGAAIEDLTSDEMQQPGLSGSSIADLVHDARDSSREIANLIAAVIRREATEAPGEPLAIIESQYQQIRSWLSELDHDQQDTDTLQVEWLARQGLHYGLHALADIGRLRVEIGAGAATETGSVQQINVSNGGVPKAAVDSAQVGPGGVSGDTQNDRNHHGRPVQAVCLWSAEVIADLAEQGHPIAAGNAGENITLTGIEWAALRPGSRIDVGPVPMLISAHAVPCSKNAQWFSDRDFGRILHERNPGLSRLYAIPLGTGEITTSDTVIVEP